MPEAQIADQSLQGTPFGKSFAGHDTFAFRYMWLKQGIDHLRRDAEVFTQDDSIVRLGVGKNMVRSIRHWCVAARVAEEEPGTRGRRMRPTELGNRLLQDDGWDPFLEDDATLWLLHWNLASAGTRTATWFIAFNQFHEYAFTRRAMVEFIMRRLEAIAWSGFAAATLERDVDCFIHTYLVGRARSSGSDDELSCPLSTLALLVQEPDGDRYRFQRGPKPTLPPAVFAYALHEFWAWRDSDRDIMDIRDIIGAEGSPGLVFKLDEDSVLWYLEALHKTTGGAMVLDETQLVRHVVRNHDQELEPMGLLEAYYGQG